MTHSINIATELNDETFHFTRTSVYSFLQNNPQFDGEILYLTHRSKPISSKNLTIIQKLYNKINLIRFEDYPEICYLEKNAQVDKNILKLSLLFQEEPVFYFKNSSLFVKDFLDLLDHEKSMITPDFDLVLFNRDIAIDLSNRPEYLEILNLIKDSGVGVFNPTVYSSSSCFSDKKFKQYSNVLAISKVIIFDFNSPDSTKIQQVWLQKNKEALQYSDKPINVSKKGTIENPRSGTFELSSNIKPKNAPAQDYINPLTKNIIESINRANREKVFEGAANAFNYFKDKNICLIANSSELLQYKYGDFIESHDIIVRFNGYRIVPENTGLRTDVHCVFREYLESSSDYIDYKIVISNNTSLWSNSITKYHSKDAVLRKYKILDFNYPTIQQLNRAGCSNIKVPTSGLATFAFLHSLGLSKNIKLFGFNGYNGGDPSSILRDNSDSTLASAHNYKLEREYWSTRFDEILPGVLKFKY